MSKNSVIIRDCNDFCKSRQHGDVVTSAITKCAVSDLELCSYINYVCTNCEIVKDSVGRTALHVAASKGRVKLIRWLKSRGTNNDLRDEESGYTALHRALFYRKLNAAVELIKQGVNLSVLDKDGLTPIEHVVVDGVKPTAICGTLYTWGSNVNNSLGSFASKKIPESLDIFHKKHPNHTVTQVHLSKFHSVFVTQNSQVYSCGHGLGGRLGLGTEQSIFQPTKIDFQSHKILITSTAIGRDHSMFLSSTGIVFTCGFNKNRVLGLSPPREKVLVPKKLELISNDIIIGLSASTYHSIAWSINSLYSWGTNLGQMGNSSLKDNKHFIQPTFVSEIDLKDTQIFKVVTSEGATAVLTLKGHIYVLHEYKCRKILPKNMKLIIVSLAITGGNLNKIPREGVELEPSKELKIVALSYNRDILFWRESDQHLNLCVNSIPRSIQARSIAINSKEILFVSIYGEAFKAEAPLKKEKKNVIRKIECDQKIDDCENVVLKTTKIPKIYRAISITSDPKGEDYCVIQQSPLCPPQGKLAERDSNEHTWNHYLSELWNETNLDDNIHDVEIKVGTKTFAAHRFILAQKCDILRSQTNTKQIHIENVEPDLFEEFLSFIYTGSCKFIEAGEYPQKFRDNKQITNPVVVLKQLAKIYSCRLLSKYLEGVTIDGTVIRRRKLGHSEYNDSEFERDHFPEYFDTGIKCSDGVTVKAHKCILYTRITYFNHFFSTRWNDGSNDIATAPHGSKLIKVLLDFIYTNSLKVLIDKDGDFLLKLIVLADEYLMQSFKRDIEIALLSMNYVDLKNAIDVLQFAHYYQAEKLKLGVMEFVLHNLAYFLETEALSDLNDDILNELTNKYEHEATSRVITPYSNAPSDEQVAEIHKTYSWNTNAPKIRETRGKRRTKSLRLSEEKKETENEQPEPEKQVIETKEAQKILSTPDKRLSAIIAATSFIELTENKPEFTNLNRDFPTLGTIRPSTSHQFVKSPDKIIRRISQKERKRLSSENKDIPESPPKNPWKQLPSVESPPSPTDGFRDIIINEKKQKENFVKLANKMLLYTQQEDKAISELEKFYNSDNIEDEIIQVQRVSIGNVASPVWVPKTS